MTTYQGGVPAIPYQRWVHDFFNLDPTKHTRSVFRFYWFATMIAGGIAFTYLTVDQRQVRNLWYNRPDLKPFPAMVAKDDLDITEQTALEAHFQSYRNKKAAEDRKQSSWYRLFFPKKADYNVKYNPYNHHSKDDIYNPATGFYSSIHNHYRDHYQE